MILDIGENVTESTKIFRCEIKCPPSSHSWRLV